MAHAEAPHVTAGLLEAAGDGEDRVLVAGDDHRVGPVHGGHRHPVVEQRCHLGLGYPEGDHRSTGWECAHEATAGGDEGDRVVEGQHPGQVGGSELADRVAEKVVGCRSPGLDEPVEGDLQGEQAGLGVLGLVEEVAAVEHHVPEGPVQSLVERGADRVEGVGVRGERRVQVTAHAGPL